MKEKYFCTDPDSAQWCCRIDDYTWSYIECRTLGCGDDEKYVVCQQVIDLRDYSIDELTSYCIGYYDSLEEIVEIYGTKGTLQIIAECIFEQLPLIEMLFAVTKKTFDDAEKFIKKWIYDNAYINERHEEDCQNQIEEAKNIIDNYCVNEFLGHADFSNLEEIGIGYTTITDEEIPIQIYVNLNDYMIERYLGEILINVKRYTSLESLICDELKYLEFDELIQVTDEELALYRIVHVQK